MRLDTPFCAGGQSNLSMSEVEGRFLGQNHMCNYLITRIFLRLFPRGSFIKGDGAVFVRNSLQ